MSGLVYLLGGSSSVGKTTAAAAVAQRLGAAHVQVDAIAQASQDPRVRRFQADVDALWSLPAAQVCELLIERARRWRHRLTPSSAAARRPPRSP